MALNSSVKTLKDVNKIDDRLTQIYENQQTTNTSTNYIDRSEILLQQMNFIALNNKSFLNFK